MGGAALTAHPQAARPLPRSTASRLADSLSSLSAACKHNVSKALAPRPLHRYATRPDYPGNPLELLAVCGRSITGKTTRADLLRATKLLIRRGIDIDALDPKTGETALHKTCIKGHTELALLLIDEARAAVDITSDDGYSALMHAAAGGHTSIVRALVVAGASVNRRLLHGNVHFSSETALHGAATNDHVDVLNILINAGARLDAQAGNGKTPLRIACDLGHVQVASALLRAGAAVDVRGGSDERTALLAATRLGHVGIVRLLVQGNAQLDERDVHSHRLPDNGSNNSSGGKLSSTQNDRQGSTHLNFTAIHWAAHNGHTELCRVLARAGAALDIKDSRGKTVLAIATEKGHSDVIRKLIATDRLDLEQQSNAGQETALTLAAIRNLPGIAKILLLAGAFVDARDVGLRTPLHIAAANGFLDVVLLLLTHGCDLNLVDKKKESTALILASKYLRVEVARALVQAGASLTYRDVNKLTAFAWAEEKEGEDGKDSESVAIQNILLPMQHTHVTDANDVFASGDAAALEDELLARTTTKPTCIAEHHVGAYSKGGTMFTPSKEGKASKFNIDRCKAIIHQLPPGLDHADQRGRTSLSYCARHGHNAIATALIAGHCDLNVLDICGYTPLVTAARFGNLDVARAILQGPPHSGNGNGNNNGNQHADVDARTVFGSTALIWACRRGHTEIARLVIQAGANLEVRDWKQRTALLVAVRNGFGAIVTALVTHRAERDVRDERGQTALIIAAGKGSIRSVMALVKVGAALDVVSREPVLRSAEWSRKAAQPFDPAEPTHSGARLNIKDESDQRTALHYAAANGELQLR